MINDITVNSLVFKLIYSDATGSLHRETSRGVNLPTELTIRHQMTKNASSKKPERRSVVRFDRTVEASDPAAEPAVVSLYLVGVIPSDPNVTATDTAALLATALAFCNDSPGNDLMAGVLDNQDQ
jgi:hypothetical protein